MMNDWADRMPSEEVAQLWRQRMDEEVATRVAQVERDLRRSMERQGGVPIGFYEAMQGFLALRDRMFPGLPGDPAWKILVTLAQTPGESAKASVTGIAHGANVPMTTALRYIGAMEMEGLVERVPHPADRRQTMIRLTAEGRRRLDAIAERWAARAVAVLGAPLLLLLTFAQQVMAGF